MGKKRKVEVGTEVVEGLKESHTNMAIFVPDSW